MAALSADIDRDDAPLGLPAVAGLGPDPADVGPHDGDDGLRLELADELVVGRPVVDLLLAVGAFAVGPVEPDLVDRAVVGQQLAELAAEVLVVAGRIAVALLVAVPGREIDPEAHPGFAAGRGDFAHDVALPVPPGAALDGVVGQGRRPEAEPVVVLGRDDERLHPGVLDHPDPLPGVEGGRVEELGILRPLAPFAVGEGVHPEMGEGDELAGLPGRLARRGHDRGGLADDRRLVVAGAR